MIHIVYVLGDGSMSFDQPKNVKPGPDDRCDICGALLKTHGDEPCSDGGSHVWAITAWRRGELMRNGSSR